VRRRKKNEHRGSSGGEKAVRYTKRAAQPT
jgi:hypothetical protein